MRRVCEKALLLIAALAIVASTSDPSSAQMMGRENASAKKKHTAYVQTNLVSDGRVTANTVDPNLKNPWGLAFFPGADAWCAPGPSGSHHGVAAAALVGSPHGAFPGA